MGHGDGKKRSLQTKWQEGIWLGHCRKSNEAWIGTPTKAVRAWTARRRVAAERWDAHAVTKLRATPEDPEVLSQDTSASNPAEDEAEEEPPTEEEEEEEAPADDHGFPMVTALVEKLMSVDVTEVFSPRGSRCRPRSSV